MSEWNSYLAQFRAKNPSMSLKECMSAASPLYQAKKSKGGAKNVSKVVKKVSKKLLPELEIVEEELEQKPVPKVKKIKSQVGGSKNEQILPLGIKNKYSIGAKGPEKVKGKFFED
jgi:hypothetical protein